MNAPSEIGVQPSHLHSWSNFWYFVAYIVVVSYTLLNLYIGEGMQCAVHLAVCLQHLLVAILNLMSRCVAARQLQPLACHEL